MLKHNCGRYLPLIPWILAIMTRLLHLSQQYPLARGSALLPRPGFIGSPQRAHRSRLRASWSWSSSVIICSSVVFIRICSANFAFILVVIEVHPWIQPLSSETEFPQAFGADRMVENVVDPWRPSWRIHLGRSIFVFNVISHWHFHSSSIK